MTLVEIAKVKLLAFEEFTPEFLEDKPLTAVKLNNFMNKLDKLEVR